MVTHKEKLLSSVKFNAFKIPLTARAKKDNSQIWKAKVGKTKRIKHAIEFLTAER